MKKSETVCLTQEQRAALIGTAIEGSRFVRDFCVRCGEPIRVVQPGMMNECTDCQGSGVVGCRPFGVERQDITYHGGMFMGGEW